MKRRSLHRRFALVAMLILILAGPLLQQAFVPLARASTAIPGRNLTVVPVRWCAMAGTKVANDPGFFGEPDTDSVLWRRHERPTDRIWIPGADITFRSAITWSVLTNDNFPVLTDSNTSVGAPGDVIDPTMDGGEDFLTVKHDCEDAWRKKNWLAGTPVVGITGISINRFVDTSGNPTSLGGWGITGIYSFPSSDPFCTAPQNLSISEAGGFAVVDPSTNSAYMAGNYDGDSRLVGHEIGHTLGLEHGDGVDSDNDGVFDGYPGSTGYQGCDPNEPLIASGFSASIMNNPSTNAVTRNRPGNRDQFTRARAFASKLSGGLVDPPGVLVPGPSIGDRATDPYRDVSARSVDVLTVGFAFSPIESSVMLSQELFGVIDREETNQYLFFLDLDADPTTGGMPSDLGLPTAFEGAEIVGRVLFTSNEPYPTVWQYDGSSFVEFTGDGVFADIQAPRGGEEPIETNNAVILGLPMSLTGAPKPTLRFQAVAQQIGTGSELDVVPGGGGQKPGPGSDTVHIVPPEYPICAVSPAQVDPGDMVTVEATGFRRADEGVHVILGDELVAQATLDSTGTAFIDFQVPSNARHGLRLVTIGVDDSALTADCALQVGPIEERGDEPVTDEQAQASQPEDPASGTPTT